MDSKSKNTLNSLDASIVIRILSNNHSLDREGKPSQQNELCDYFQLIPPLLIGAFRKMKFSSAINFVKLIIRFKVTAPILPFSTKWKGHCSVDGNALV
jgi:hypothetical protein